MKDLQIKDLKESMPAVENPEINIVICNQRRAEGKCIIKGGGRLGGWIHPTDTKIASCGIF